MPKLGLCLALPCRQVSDLLLLWLPGLRTGPKAPPHVTLLSQILHKNSCTQRFHR